MADYHWFEVCGIELEYMIVDRDTLDVRPWADKLMQAAAGELTSDYVDGPITWSNELAMHVIELKTTEPVRSLAGVAQDFQRSIRHLNDVAAEFNACLLPTGMHPWMDPDRELQLWPHDSSVIYEAFNRIFNCRGHGWANLQSMHINLPFGNAEEFGRLHAAIRLLLPLLPGLACSSPIAGGRRTGFLDYRMEVYRQNSAKIPQVAGVIVPEPVFHPDDYQQQIFQPMYQAIAPYDPDGILQYPFLNARGAIARFDRGSIEIRVIDTQEQPAADLAIAAIVVETLQQLTAETWTPFQAQCQLPTEGLAAVFRAGLRAGEQAMIEDAEYLRQFGWSNGPCTLQALWRHLVDSSAQPTSRLSGLGDDSQSTPAADRQPLERILQQGPLARRILAATSSVDGEENAELGDVDAVVPERLRAVYRQLATCLADGHSFPAEPLA
jgi:glutamate---cysteine ligase / carboxylate-amine ligase